MRFAYRLVVATLLPAVLSSQQPQQVLHGPEPIRRQPYARYVTHDTLGRPITFFLSDSGDRALPLVVYVQGSGFASHFVPASVGFASGTGHASLVDAARGRARVLLVEKPGVTFGSDGRGEPPAEFRREHTLEHWSTAIVAAIRAARTLPSVDTTRLLVIGHSEGGIVAARVARVLPEVGHVALLAGEGPSQWVSLVALAREGALLAQVGETPDQREHAVRAAWDSIRADPHNASRMWFGHAYPRWASFLSTSPIEQLAGARARVLIVQGDADRAVLPSTADSLYAALRARGQEAQIERVGGADHSFRLASGEDRWGTVLSRVLDWFQR
jgi:dipeptidyl aminopeptidase/acylaminoacyl peptidase